MDGTVAKYDPQVHAVQKSMPPVEPMTRHQRATLYFRALRALRDLLCEVGFSPTADLGHSGFSLEMDRFILEMVVKEAPRMAYVTSSHGYVYDSKKVNASVTMACPVEPGEYAIQITASYLKGTPPPLFVVARNDSPDVFREAFFSALSAAQDFIARQPGLSAKIKAGLTTRDLSRDLDRFGSDGDLLPPTDRT